jgi:tRNA threonylcarbamoyladenosine biosynthesis protein TsaE
METLHIESETDLESVTLVALRLLSDSKIENQASVLALTGDLGAGKTAFTKTLAKVLGVTDVVTSPTFVIMKQYQTDGTALFDELVHIDAYKIEDCDEMRPLRFSEVLQRKDSVVCIEWAEKIKPLLPEHTLYMHIKSTGEQSRTITFL